MPSEIDGTWNWGGFLLPPLFAIVNRLWIWLAAWIAIAASGALPTVGTFTTYAGIGLGVALAMRGNALAWRSRRWESVAHFRRVQRRTAWWSLGITLVIMGLIVAAIAIGDGLERSSEPTSYQAHGITFTYPAGWGLDEGATLLTGFESVETDWIDALFPEDGDGLIIVYGLDIGLVPSARQIEAIGRTVTREIEKSGHAVTYGPHYTDVGGLPAIRAESGVTTPDGGTASQRFYVIVLGETAIQLKCQSPPGDTTTVQACDSIVESFRAA